MRWVAVFFLAAGVMLTASTLNARGLGCGFEPLAPFGCVDAQAQCICDDNSNCQWFFIGCN